MAINITERRESTLQVLVEAISEGALTLTAEGNILTCNSRFTQMSNVPVEQILSSSLHQFFPAHEHAALERLFEKAKRVAGKGEFTLLRGGGSSLAVELSIHLLEMEEKEGILALVNDLSERKRHEHEICQSERRFRLLADQAHGFAIIMLDTEGRITDWNDGAQRLHGYSQEEITGQSFARFYTPEDLEQDKPRRELERAAAEGHVEVEGWRVRKDGSRFWASAVIMALRTPERLIGYSKLVRDLTERKRLEQALSQSTMDLNAAQRLANVGSWEWLPEPDEAIWSDEMYHIFGLNPQEPAPKYAVISRHFTAESMARLDALMQQALQTGNPFHVDLELVRPDGTHRWITNHIETVEKDHQLGKVAKLRGTVQDITERRQAEETLRQSEEHFHSVFASAAVGLSISNLDGRFLDVNPAFAFITGYTKEELLARDFQSITHREDRPKCLELYRKLLDGTFPSIVAQKRYVTKGGGIVWVQNSVSLFRDASGRLANIVAITEDITERKWAEDSLRHAKTYAEKLIQYANVMIVGLDRSGLIQMFNRAAEELSGYSREELLGRDWFEVFLRPEICRSVRGNFMRLLAEGKPWEHECTSVTKEGKERTISWCNNQLREDDQIVGSLSFGIDITERKRTEEALRRSEERFRRVAELVPEMIFTCQPDGWTDYYNAAFYRYTGLSPGSASGYAWLDWLHPDDLDRVKNLWLTAIRTGEVFETQYRLRGAKGEYRWFLSRKCPIRGLNNEIVQWQGVTTDIEEQKRAEEILGNRVAQRTAKLQETVAELEQFSFSITHDLRAPLRAIQGYVGLLKEDCASTLSEAGRGYLQNITVSSERMENLIRDSLNYGKILRSEFPLEQVDAGKLTREIIQSYPALQSPRAQVILDQEIPRILGNGAAMTQCISNLLLNAVKFVAPGTLPCVRVGAEVKGDWVRIWFEDNGIGIPEVVQERIFGMFEQLDKTSEGTGIGLAIVRKAVERMGGKAGVESEPGRGSRFWLDLKRIT